MKILTALATLLLITACTPFTFNESNKDMAYVALSIGVSKQCQSRLHTSLVYFNGVNVEGGRPLNLRNPWISADYDDEFDSILYSFPIKAGLYEISRITGGDQFIETYKKGDQLITKYKPGKMEASRYEVEAGKVNYLGNLVVDSVDKACKGPDWKIIKKDQRARDLADVAANEPQLF